MSAGEVTNPEGTERLHEYWVHGEGAAKIAWGTPGDFSRCVTHLGKYIRDPEGYCNLAHHAALGIYPATHAAMEKGRSMAELSTSDINDLPDSAFAYIEDGGSKDSSGKTVPRSLRHFPVHDAAHVRNALSRAPQSPFGEKAMPKIKAAAAKMGVHMSDMDGDGDGERSLPGRPVERRYTSSVVGVMLIGGEESRDGAPRRIGGYAAKFNTYSRDLGHFVEQVHPVFFNKSKGNGWPGVLCRFNHDSTQLLGTTEGRTLGLNTDRDGLLYEVEPPRSMQHIVEYVERGDVRKSSFAFRCYEDEWSLTSDGGPLRTLHSGALIDVAPVVEPAYVDTTAGLRSLAGHFDASLDEVRSMAEAGELRRFFTRSDGGAPPAPRRPRISGPQAMMRLMEKRYPDLGDTAQP